MYVACLILSLPIPYSHVQVFANAQFTKAEILASIGISTSSASTDRSTFAGASGKVELWLKDPQGKYAGRFGTMRRATIMDYIKKHSAGAASSSGAASSRRKIEARATERKRRHDDTTSDRKGKKKKILSSSPAPSTRSSSSSPTPSSALDSENMDED